MPVCRADSTAALPQIWIVKLKPDHFASNLVYGQILALRVNPAELLATDAGLVAVITVNMSAALIPSAPREQFTNLDRPFGLWIGSADELFLPEKALAFADLASSVLADSRVGTIAGAKHLSVLLSADEIIGSWIRYMVQEKKV